MKLKEIKPGMNIHCKNDEEQKLLLEEAERLGYVWYSTKERPTERSVHEIGDTIHFYDAGTNIFSVDYKHITHSNCIGDSAIEFSDLIIPEMSAEEALMIRGTICDGKICVCCPLSNDNNGEGETCNKFLKNHAGKAVELLAKWKSENEKKEPEIEWVYRVFGAENNGEKFFQTEEEAIKRCEELAKSQKSKQYARYERVCRVKAVE